MFNSWPILCGGFLPASSVTSTQAAGNTTTGCKAVKGSTGFWEVFPDEGYNELTDVIVPQLTENDGNPTMLYFSVITSTPTGFTVQIKHDAGAGFVAVNLPLAFMVFRRPAN